MVLFKSRHTSDFPFPPTFQHQHQKPSALVMLFLVDVVLPCVLPVGRYSINQPKKTHQPAASDDGSPANSCLASARTRPGVLWIIQHTLCLHTYVYVYIIPMYIYIYRDTLYVYIYICMIICVYIYIYLYACMHYIYIHVRILDMSVIHNTYIGT